MTEYELGVYTGMFGTLLVVMAIAFLWLGRELKKTNWDTLSVNNWNLKRSKLYKVNTEGDDGIWIRSRNWSGR